MITQKISVEENRFRKRYNFSRIPTIVEIPNLIEMQTKSYEQFIQRNRHPLKRDNKGLEGVFRSVFPISDLNRTSSLEYIGYEIGVWECGCGEYKGLGGSGVVCEKCNKNVMHKEKYSVEECNQKGMTYADPLKVLVRLVLYDKEKVDCYPNPDTTLIGKYLFDPVIHPVTGKIIFRNGDKITMDMLSILESEKISEIFIRRVSEVREQKIYLGEMPLMTEKGTFIINGTERVIVSQMHRSPGAFFSHDKGKTHSSGKIIYSARIIPYRGSWIDFEFDAKDILYARIDRRRKLPATVFLHAMGLSTGEILNEFYENEKVIFNPDDATFSMNVTDLLIGQRLKEDIKDPESGEIMLKAGKRVSRTALKKIKKLYKEKSIIIDTDDLIGKIIAIDVVDKKTGEILLEVNGEITAEFLENIKKNKVTEFTILRIDEESNDLSLRDTIMISKINSLDDALREIYKRMRPGDPPTIEIAITLFNNMFFNIKRYDLSEVGRLKLNEKFGLNLPLQERLLTKEDIIATIKYLLHLRRGIGFIDDIDHLGNRRVRAVGESIENQFRVGLVRMERAIIERMSMENTDSVMPHDLINSKPVTAAIKEFFGSSQLSQFMDQTNPLSEITHKRRLSALGPGGLTRERAGFEVRDVHPTHYGRICPIETPEGPNIGLISSMGTYARVNDFGFLETPYRKVKNGKLTGEVRFLTAIEEDKFVIAQANAELDSEDGFAVDLVSARKGGEFVMVSPEQVDYIDVSPKQLISAAASLIPFLEHDDANRALMGSNMQRQAVPLLKTEAPIVGTAMEGVVAKNSGAVVVAKGSGEVISVDSSRIVIRRDGADGDGYSKVDIYSLLKYQRSNQNTCLNHKAVVAPGDKIKKGDVIADGPATDKGELALGRNLLVAFMPWEGYNFEDAIIVSEKIVKEDIFTSIHIEEFDVEARDTKQGKEEITRDIPNVGEESLKDLDESGIIRIGASVKSDDVLAGKVTPKGETQLSAEEKLLKAIFGDKAGDVRDTSLRVPPGIEGTVVDVKVFARKGVDKDSRALTIEEEEIAKIEKDFYEEIRIVTEERDKDIKNLLLGKITSKQVVNPRTGKVVISKNKQITNELLDKIPSEVLLNISILESDIKSKIGEIEDKAEDHIHLLKTMMNENISRLRKGDELSPGVIKLVKVFVAMKRKLSVGDKMAGRHGNKGVVSKIVPEEDMPYMEDGTPIELILNPLGVPSRMNVGQILETNLGMAAKRKGIYVASPVFDGATESDIRNLLKETGFSETGKVVLYEGKTGNSFDQRVVVGYIYMMKLHHLVDDKIHARSTGPYSLITQQPLGGKAQFGGQRLGEMEVWALEGYGAAYILQEMLTVKSDDVEGRKRMYEAIVKGDSSLHPNLPESFNVLVKELQSLALDVELMEEK